MNLDHLVAANVEELRGIGYRLVKPREGLPAYGESGHARTGEPKEIVDAVGRAFTGGDRDERR